MAQGAKALVGRIRDVPEQFLFLDATPPIAMLVIVLVWVAAGFRRA